MLAEHWDFHLVKSLGSSVQAVGPIVEEQLILLPVQGEPPVRNPVGNTAYDSTEERVLPRVTWPEKQHMVKQNHWNRTGGLQECLWTQRCLSLLPSRTKYVTAAPGFHRTHSSLAMHIPD